MGGKVFDGDANGQIRVLLEVFVSGRRVFLFSNHDELK